MKHRLWILLSILLLGALTVSVVNAQEMVNEVADGSLECIDTRGPGDGLC